MVEFAILGPLRVLSDDGPELIVRAGRQRVLLASLLVRAGRVVSADMLAEYVWDAQPPPGARATLQSYVMRLRRLLGPEAGARIITRTPGYLVNVADELDLHRFERLRREGSQAAACCRWEQAASAFGEALALWRGEPLADVPSDALHREEYGRLADARVTVTELWAEAKLRAGQPRDVVFELSRLSAAHPYREGLHGLLMTALYRSGRRTEALGAFVAVRRRLLDEVGVEPGPQLVDLHARILDDDPDLDSAAGYPACGAAAAVAGGGHAQAAQHTRLDDRKPSAADEHGLSGSGLPKPRQLPTGAADFATREEQVLPSPGTDARPPGTSLADRGEPVPRQLPPAVRHFAGRADALKTLAGLVEDAAPPGGTVVISAIDGTAGIGKTALALRWAHQVAGRFPDGQLYVNLRGFDPGGPPVPPGEAICGFLVALGVPSARIPVGLDAQTAQYRSLLAGKRVLVLLDNARDVGQVRPLLPGSPGCLVVVTSRVQLLGLVAADGAHPLTLDLFTPAEAREMLARRLGTERASREQDEADELIELCARLPLALNIATARAATQPERPLADLVRQLRDAHGRLDMLSAGDPVTDVRAVFSWSCLRLGALAGRMFRLLGGVHPGPDISAPAAASLAGVPLGQARQVLAELTGARLVTEHPAGRFSFHDLLREYAAEQTQALDSDAERTAALGRVLDHYLHTACRAARLLAPTRDPITVAAPGPGSAPEDIADDAQALAWLEAEYPVLIGAIAAAARSGLDTHAWQLPWALSDFLDRSGRWQAYAATQDTALAAAMRLRDPGAQARVRAELGYAHGMLGSYPDADRHLRSALDLYRRLGDRGNEVIVSLRLAHLLGWQDRNAEARDHAMRALEIAQDGGHLGAQANALNTVGWYSALLGDHRDALVFCRQALDLLRLLGDRFGQGAVLDSLGYIYRNLGDHRNALDYYQQALRIFSDLGDRYKQSEALTGLGDTHRAAGDAEAALDHYRQACAILADLGHPDSDVLRGRLNRTAPEPTASSR